MLLQEKMKMAAIGADIARARKYGQLASVDSEIALVRAARYSLSGPLPNALFPGNQNREFGTGKGKTLMKIRDGAIPLCLMMSPIQSVMLQFNFSVDIISRWETGWEI